MLVKFSCCFYALLSTTFAANCDWDAGYNAVLETIENYTNQNPPHRPPIVAENGTGYAQSRAMAFGFWVTALPGVFVDETRIVLSGGVEIYIDAPEFNFNLSETCNVELPMEKVDYKKLWWPAIYSPHVNDVEISGQNHLPLFIGWGFIGLLPYNYAEMNLICNFDPTNYPFETQVCSVKFLVTGSSGINLNLNSGTCYFWRYHDINISWDILGCNAEVALDYHQKRRIITVNLLLQRKPQYGFYAIIIPMILLIVTNPIIFILPPQETCKCDVGVAFMLAFFIFMQTMQNNLPATQQQPYLYFCILAVVAINAAAILASSILCIMNCPVKAAKWNRIALVGMIAAEIIIILLTVFLLAFVPRATCTKKDAGANLQGEEGQAGCVWNGTIYGTDWTAPFT